MRRTWKKVDDSTGLITLACVASVSVRFGSKEIEGDKWSDYKRRDGGGGGRGEGWEETLAD